MARPSILSFLNNPEEQKRIREAAGISAPKVTEDPGRPRFKAKPFVDPTVSRPTFVSDERQRAIAASEKEIADAYIALMAAIKRGRELAGAMPDPTIDPRQLLFPFATKFVSVHQQMMPHAPDVGLNGQRTRMVVHPPRNRPVTKMIIPECRGCHVRLIPPVPGRGYKSENAEKRMERIFGVIYSESDSI